MGILGTVGSDAHAVVELGRAAMLMEYFDDAVSFKTVLESARYETRLSGLQVRFFSRYAKVYKTIFGNPCMV